MADPWTPERDAAVLVRCEAATHGRWLDGAGVYAGAVIASDGETLHVVCLDPDGDDRPEDRAFIAAARADLPAAVAEIRRLRELLNTPELHDFAAAVVREAAHQRERWGTEHDGGKTPADWFWLIGYLAGKALAAAIGGDTDKALHHCISTAAVLANWHAAIGGTSTSMRPGIAPPAEGSDGQ